MCGLQKAVGHSFSRNLWCEISEWHSDFSDFSGRKNRKGIFGQKLTLNTPISEAGRTEIAHLNNWNLGLKIHRY